VVTPRRLHAPLFADFWRCQPTTRRGRIIEAPSMFEARVGAVARRLAPGVPSGESLRLSAEMVMALMPGVVISRSTNSVLRPVES
jgi:hypothetical protein